MNNQQSPDSLIIQVMFTFPLSLTFPRQIGRYFFQYSATLLK